MASVATIGLVSISDAESTTGWTGDTFSLEPDIKVEGSNSVACAQTNNGTNDLSYTGSFSLNGSHLRLFWNISYVGNQATTNPVQISLTDGTNTDYFTYFTSNTDYAGGWVDLVVVVDATNFPNVYNQTITGVGVRVNTGSKPRNVPANCWVDNWRALDGLTLTSTTTEAFNFANAAAIDATNVYNLLVNSDGVIFATGEIVIGNATANANFVSANETLVFPNRNVASALYKLEFNSGTGTTDIDISGLVCKTVNSAQAAELLLDATYNTLSITGSSFITMGTMTITPTVTTPTFDANSFTGCGTTSLGLEATGCAWNNCSTVTVTTNGKLTDCSFAPGAGVTAVTINANSTGVVDGTTFTSAGTGHAIELTETGLTTFGITGVTFENYAGTNGTTGNEAIYVNGPTGAVTINASGVTGAISIRNATASSVTVVSDPRTVTVTAVETDGTLISGAEVFLRTNGAGSLPHNASVSISNSGTTATVTHTAHGMATNDKIVVYGAATDDNLGVHQITVTDANTYTFTTTGTNSGTDAGSPVVYFVYVAGTTSGAGTVSASRVYPSSQAARGTIRKATTAPYYKPASLTGTVSSTADTSFTGVMLAD